MKIVACRQVVFVHQNPVNISHMICQRAHAMAFTRLFRARGQVPSTTWLRCMLTVYSSHLATGIRCLSQLWPCQSADGQITTIRLSAGYCLEQLICCYSLVYSAVSCFLIAVLGSKPELQYGLVRIAVITTGLPRKC